MRTRQTVPAPAGSPDALERAVDHYAATEAALLQAAEDLAGSMGEGKGQAIDALGERRVHAKQVLDAAHERYQGTRAALRDYTVELRAFHQATNRAGENDDAAQGDLNRAAVDADDARRELRQAAMNPDDTATIDYWDNELHRALNARNYAEDAVATAWAEYQFALDVLDTAAQTAIARIEASFEGTNDSRLDKIGAWIDAVAGLFASLMEWAENFLREVLELVLAAITVFLTVVLFVIVLVAIVAAIGLALLVLAAFIASPILTLIVLSLAATALSIVKNTFLGTLDALGIEGLERIRLFAVIASVACPPLGLLILTRLADEALAGPLTVDKLDPASLESKPRSRQATLDEAIPDSADDFLEWATMVDDIGGDGQAVVDIARIVDEFGQVSWVVTVPSTKDWVLDGDSGAPNDLDADFMLMLTPELRSQYEAAVLEAMDQANIPSGEPVVMAGWSLGGIIAGGLIESGAGGYSYAGLICGGSPIDHMKIPEEIPVLQVKHTLDPVHRLDMIDGVPDTKNHISVWDGQRSGGARPEIMTGNGIGHDGEEYMKTLQSHIAYNDRRGGTDFNAMFAEVLPEHASVRHTQYEFSE